MSQGLVLSEPILRTRFAPDAKDHVIGSIAVEGKCKDISSAGCDLNGWWKIKAIIFFSSEMTTWIGRANDEDGRKRNDDFELGISRTWVTQ